MQEAFQSKDMGKLEEALAAMPVDETEYHMKRLEEAGLWVTDKDEAGQAAK